jgi:hypothetical protein
MAMSTADNSSLVHSPNNLGPQTAPRPAWTVLLKKLACWSLFLALLYLIRDFFFTAFMTFLFSYLTLQWSAEA